MLTKTAKRNTRGERELDFEGLEQRVMLAASIDGDGNLTVDGTAGDDLVVAIAPAAGTVLVLATDAVLTGSTGQAAGPVPVVPGISIIAYTGVNDVTVNAGDGNDLVAATGTFQGELNINLGDGAANLAVVNNASVGTVGEQEALRIFGGAGTDLALVDTAVLNEDLNIRTEGATDIVAVQNTIVRNDAEIFTGDGDDLLVVGPLGIGTGEFTEDNLDIDMGNGNDFTVVNTVILADPLVPGAVLAHVRFLGNLGNDTLIQGVTPVLANEVVVDGFETVV
jgi:hypothetical protein